MDDLPLITVDSIIYIPETTKTIFFDNERKNLFDVKIMFPDIHCVLIDDKIPNKLGKTVVEYNTHFSENKYIKDMAMVTAADAVVNILEPVEGVSLKKHLPELEKWINSSGDQKEIIFDWDRTLSVMEGFRIQPQNMTDDIVTYTAVYLMGGQSRFEALKTFFAICLSKNVTIIILTNNQMAEKDTDRRTFFLKVIKQIISKFEDSNLLYSGGNVISWIEKDDDDVKISEPNNKGLTLKKYYQAKTGGKSNKQKRRQTKRTRRMRILHARRTFAKSGLPRQRSVSRVHLKNAQTK